MFSRTKIQGLRREDNIIIQNGLLIRLKIIFKGRGNVIFMAQNTRIENYSIKIYGNYNKINVGEYCQMKNGEF